MSEFSFLMNLVFILWKAVQELQVGIASRLICPTRRVLKVEKNVLEKMWEKLLLVLNKKLRMFNLGYVL